MGETRGKRQEDRAIFGEAIKILYNSIKFFILLNELYISQNIHFFKYPRQIYLFSIYLYDFHTHTYTHT